MSQMKLISLKLIVSIIFLITFILGVQAISNSIKMREIKIGKIVEGDQILDAIKEWPNPKATEDVMVMAMQNLQNCRFVELASEELLKIDSRSAQAFYMKALCADALGDQNQALNLVKKAIELQPLNTVYMEAKFRLEWSLSDTESALATYSELQRKFPDYLGLRDLKSLINSSGLRLDPNE